MFQYEDAAADRHVSCTWIANRDAVVCETDDGVDSDRSEVIAHQEPVLALQKRLETLGFGG